jgi:hypothetical protein
MSHCLRVIAWLGLPFGLQACGFFGHTSDVHSQGPVPIASEFEENREGLRYYLARDILALDAKVVSSKTTHWEVNPQVVDTTKTSRKELVNFYRFGVTSDGTPAKDSAKNPVVIRELLDSFPLCVAAREPTSWDSTLFINSTVTLPDIKAGAYRLGMRVNSRSTQNLNIDVSQAGILKNVSINVEDKRAEVIANVIQGVAGVAGTLVGGAVTLAKGGATPLFREPGANSYLAPPSPDAAEQGPQFTVEIRLTDDNCYVWSGKDSPGRVQRAQIEALEKLVSSAEDDRLALQRKAMGIPDAKGKGYNAALAVADSRVSVLKARLGDLTAAYTKDVSGYKGSQGIGRKADTSFVHATFDVAALSGPKVPLGADIPADSAKSLSAERRLIADSARLILVVRDLPPSSAPAVKDSRLATLGCKALADGDCVRIKFRKPQPRLMLVYARRQPHGEQNEADQPFREVSRAIIQVASSEDLPLEQTFQTKAFASAKVTLAFGDHGDVVGLAQTGEGGLASATAKIAEGLSKARTEFTSALSSVGTAQSSIYGIQRAKTQRQLQQLQDQKSLVDAQIALQGANATADIQVQSALLNAQIQELTSQQALNSAIATGERQPLLLGTQDLQAQLGLANAQAALAQQPFQTQLALANAQAALSQQPLQAQLAVLTQQQALLASQNAGAVAQQLSDIQTTIAQLKAQIDLVNQQIALERAKQDLEKARQGIAP